MEPRIQYAKTSDGVSIAYWTLGEGMPLVYTPMLSSHCEMEWQVPELRSFYEQLAQGRMLVRYDGRGTGLSEREATDFSLDARMLDLEAVVEQLGLGRFDVFAQVTAGPVAIAYAARRPERVSHLLLWCSHARGSDILQTPQGQAIFGLVDQDWVLYTETMAHATLGWSGGELAHRFCCHDAGKHHAGGGQGSHQGVSRRRCDRPTTVSEIADIGTRSTRRGEAELCPWTRLADTRRPAGYLGRFIVVSVGGRR